MEKITNHQSGFVAIIGYPNVGKSTLMNNLLVNGCRSVPIKERPLSADHRDCE